MSSMIPIPTGNTNWESHSACEVNAFKPKKDCGLLCVCRPTMRVFMRFQYCYVSEHLQRYHLWYFHVGLLRTTELRVKSCAAASFIAFTQIKLWDMKKEVTYHQVG